MKGYIVTSGVIFALLALAHVARIVLESWRLAREPEYIAITLLAAAMAVWAYRAYRRIEASRRALSSRRSRRCCRCAKAHARWSSTRPRSAPWRPIASSRPTARSCRGSRSRALSSGWRRVAGARELQPGHAQRLHDADHPQHRRAGRGGRARDRGGCARGASGARRRVRVAAGPDRRSVRAPLGDRPRAVAAFETAQPPAVIPSERSPQLSSRASEASRGICTSIAIPQQASRTEGSRGSGRMKRMHEQDFGGPPRETRRGGPPRSRCPCIHSIRPDPLAPPFLMSVSPG